MLHCPAVAHLISSQTPQVAHFLYKLLKAIESIPENVAVNTSDLMKKVYLSLCGPGMVGSV